MTRVLLLGGTGGFGARLARRLAGDGFVVLVAARNEARAAALARALPGAEAWAADRDGDVADLVRRARPDLVIDAAGPFQGGHARVPRASVEAGVPYLDLADARDFVCGVVALDEAARAAGVAVVSGASSVPALSGAVVRALAEGLERVEAIEIVISASARASVGPSVARAVLTGVGRAFRQWDGSAWRTERGWRALGRVRFEVPGARPLSRLVAPVDVPDLELLPAAWPGRPAAIFRAGTELPLAMAALALLARLFSRGVPDGLARPLLALQRLAGALGGDRSAMRVELRGRRDGQAVRRRWTLLAERGDGPEVPVLAAQLLARRAAEGGLAPGARDAGALLSLAEFEPLFRELALRTHVTEAPDPSLYERLLGPRFAALPPSLRALHGVAAARRFEGAAEVARGGGLGGLVARALGFPPSGRRALAVTMERTGEGERWTRDFGDARFVSRMSARAGDLVERVGPFRCAFRLEAGPDGLRMLFRGWSVLGVPLPRALGPRVRAVETDEGGRFRFDVAVAAPLLGEIVRYRGALRAAPAESGVLAEVETAAS